MTIEERLEVLERELAELKATQAQGAEKVIRANVIRANVIRANQFIVEDENGKDRAGLVAGKDGPGLELYKPDGKVIWSAP